MAQSKDIDAEGVSNPDALVFAIASEKTAKLIEPSVLGTSTSNLEAEFNAKKSEVDKFYQDLSKKIQLQKQKAAEREGKIQKLAKYLKAQGSPLGNPKFAKLIIELSEQSGVDYKIIMAIAGEESGFCIAPYYINGKNSHNCFGYLNGKSYASYEEAFSRLVPQIAKQYVKKYGTNFLALAKAYGVVNFEYGAQKMQKFYNGMSK